MIHDTEQTKLNKFLEEILTPHIRSASRTTIVLTPQDVVVCRVMGITTAKTPAPFLERFFCAHHTIRTNRQALELLTCANRPERLG